MEKPTLLLSTALLALILWFCAGCTSTGHATRFDPGTARPENAWYIEGHANTNGRTNTISCSFVEFDGRGDFIEFKQYQDAWHRVRQLGEKEKLLLVFYCHGWKNTAHSGDVAKFNEFLWKLANSDAVANYGYRVHGIYLSWRGNLYKPYVGKESEGAYDRTAHLFTAPIIDGEQNRSSKWTAVLQENLSYWSRRRAAENKVSSVPVARTIFTCASLAKGMDQIRIKKQKSSANADLAEATVSSSPDPDATLRLLETSRVMVMGHSFGALLLERALNATCLDPLTDQWAWFQKEGGEKDNPASKAALEARMQNPLPLDFVLFVNSAAPAIYAKTMRDFLAAHQSALRSADSPLANTPVFLSVTSSADRATRYAHPLGNLFARFAPSLQREYTDLIKMPKGRKSIHQSVFYNRTPGHQPLLVDHWIVEDQENGTPPAFNHEQVINHNLHYTAADPLHFLAVSSHTNEGLKQWKFSLHPPDDDLREKAWANQFGEMESKRSAYWIVRCNDRLIRDHNDVWSDSAMEMYAALYRLVEWTRLPQNNVPEVFNHYWSTRPTSVSDSRSAPEPD